MMWRFLTTILAILACCISSKSLATNTIHNVRISEQGEMVRVVFEFPKPVKHTYFQLKNPERLVIDLPNTSSATPLKPFNATSSLIKKVRYSTPKSKLDARVVIELHRSAKPNLFVLPADANNKNRLVVDFVDSNPPQTSVPVVTAQAPSSNRDIIIAIDAGHGGKDPGSIGPAGTYEKHIVLSASKMLADLINNTEGMKAELIRTGDYFVPLNRRPEIARERKADLFVSIHADAFHEPQPRGGSVWVLSMGRADNELGRWMERTERHSELLGGAAEVINDKASERYLAETILGLSMDHSMASSYDLGEIVIGEMKGVTRMHKSRPQSASLAVLTSPDIPSILVELGFISNPQEEKNLNWAKHRRRLASSIYDAIKTYFAQTPPDGTLWASRGRQIRTHKVRSGESLSLLAQRYNVSVRNIKIANNLSSDNVRIGQVLQIPRS
ncbi:AMIN domain-containing protein [Alteromonas sediminis]|uniref:N-acetylmuramoyl-L-alanine amidase n=1 Tax=Alteromonas sediminis TaxID=2259342 RepID=A0A3N5Z8E0_9ALTE|nr:N-acetylmuramoyl-L-alanine amidase [Alteromonas sediminis]RPJ65258.1 AMIN domain-containing protein [Alteromonas sediminis]